MKKLIVLLLDIVLCLYLAACRFNYSHGESVPMEITPVETAPVETTLVETAPVETTLVETAPAPAPSPLYDLDGYLTPEGILSLVGEEYPLLQVDDLMPTLNTSMSIYFVDNIQLHADTFRFYVFNEEYYGYDHPYDTDAFKVRLENASIVRIIYAGEKAVLISDTPCDHAKELVLHRTIEDTPVFNTILVLKTANGYRVINLMAYTPISR